MHLSSLVFLAVCSELRHYLGAAAHPQPEAGTYRRGYELDISVTRRQGLARRGDVESDVGLGNNADLLYTVPITLGGRVFAAHLDTGSSDLWVISDTCTTNSCSSSSAPPGYPQSALQPAGADLHLSYGDSGSQTFATGTIGYDVASIAAVAMQRQPFGLINDTSNLVVRYDTAGIFGLGFPTASKIQQTLVETKYGGLNPTDNLLWSSAEFGPLLSRMVTTDSLEAAMFTVTLQRSTIDIGGTGQLTVGKFPDGLSESDFTWVPLRLYTPAEGGLTAPTFAPNETYPYRWEIDIEDVFLDGERVPPSNISARSVDSDRMSAILDTGNSVLLGPSDVVRHILHSVSPSYNPASANAVAALPCAEPHTLSFQIGGKLFPIDPRDFIGQLAPRNATTCQADNLLSTDPPSVGTLFRWSLGTPFFRSNIVAFHYGNLTHPSADPPRIGIRSLVPENADDLLRGAVAAAAGNGGNFPNVLRPPPTALSIVSPTITIPQTLSAIPTPRPTENVPFSASASNDARSSYSFGTTQNAASYFALFSLSFSLSLSFSGL